MKIFLVFFVLGLCFLGACTKKVKKTHRQQTVRVFLIAYPAELDMQDADLADQE
jgi:hypothetical protein